MAEQLYPKLILDALATVRYPGNGRSIVENNMVADDLRINGRHVSFSLVFDRPTDPFRKSLAKACEAAIHVACGRDVEVEINLTSRRVVAEEPVNPLPGVKNIIGVSSGKGGVGKSTVASNLAVALAREGYRVGLLDADIFGPSVPKMFGLEKAELFVHKVNGRDLIIPAESHGVKILSIGFVVDPDKAVLWRGAMASNALRQLICDADWGELDCLVMDFPPGTGDESLAGCQLLPIPKRAIVVTTPQEVALADCRKCIDFCRRLEVPVIGIVENMSGFVCPDCSARHELFGTGGGARLAEKEGVPLLASIPLDPAFLKSCDFGELPAGLEKSSAVRGELDKVVRAVAAE